MSHTRRAALAGMAAVGLAGTAAAQEADAPAAEELPPEGAPDPGGAAGAAAPAAADEDAYTEDEVAQEVERFFGISAEAAATAVERVFREQGRPVGYIAGEEVSGAFTVGLRYGKGVMRLKSGDRRVVFWQGPSVGFDFGGNAAKVFTLIYGLTDPERIFQRFPGVEGSAYFIAGLGINYQQADEIRLAPMRAGVGFRAGASVGYLAYSAKRRILPF